jgi:hypothetical protein
MSLAETLNRFDRTNGGIPMKKIPMRAFVLLTCVLSILAPAASAVAEDATGVDAHAAFDRLKAMEGTWVGSAHGDDAEAEGNEEHNNSKHVFAVSAAGTVVMETMMPGTEHEMINMYHLDGDELVLTHYCAGGNQPTMRLDRAHSSADALSFDFTGGTNLDPAKDVHIHSAKILFEGNGQVQSNWYSYSGGEQAGEMSITLARQ